MTFLDELPGLATALGLTLAESLETAVGGRLVLTVGQPRSALAGIIPDGADVRVVSHVFTAPDATGVAAVVTIAPFTEVLEQAAPDESLLTVLRPALETTLNALPTVSTNESDASRVSDTDLEALAIESGHDVAVVVPLLRGNTPVGALVVTADQVGAGSVQIDARGPLHLDAVDGPSTARVAERVPSAMLAGIPVGVTAELGRSRMTARNFLSLAPGAVIELDRAVGAPVDVIANGTVVARGEVVVVDDEYAIRILEILATDAERSVMSRA